MKVAKPHQLAGAQWVRQRRKCILADDMRLGKTYTAAMAFHDRLPLLVLCPKTPKLHWRNELLELNPKLRVQVLRKRSDRCHPKADVWIMNYDLLGFVKPRRPVGLILDECHRLKNLAAKRTEVAVRLMRAVQYVLALSGTPMPSRPIEFWPVLFGLNITRMDYTAFAFRYANAYYDEYGALIARGASNLQELQKMVAPWMLHRKKKDVLTGYQEPEYTIITFDRPPDEWESEYDLDALFNHPNPALAFEGLSELLKLSALKKIEDAVEFIEDLLRSESKVVVFAYHHEVIDALSDALTVYNPVKLTGKTSEKARKYAAHAFQHNPECRVFVGNILAAGESLELSAAKVSVFVETTWVPKDIEQAVNRTESMAKTAAAVEGGYAYEPAQAYFLTTEASLDHYMLKRIIQKQCVIAQVVVPTKDLGEYEMETRKVEALERIAGAFERIAVALEKQGVASVAPEVIAPVAAVVAAVADPAPAVSDKPAVTATQEPTPALVVTIDDIRKAMVAYASAHGRDVAKQQLEEVGGVAMLKDLPEADYAKVYAHFTQAE